MPRRAFRRNAPRPEEAFRKHFEADPPPRLYHYTSQLAFLEIVRGKAVWATDVRYLNDYEEYVYAVQIARDALYAVSEKTAIYGGKELANAMLAPLLAHTQRSYYVFSLSENGDSLNQWRSYTKAGTGYALGFAAEGIDALCKRDGFLFGKCVYGKQEINDAIANLASSYVDELAQYFPYFGKGEINEDLIAVRSARFADLFLRHAAFIKNPAFEEEREWRIVISIDSNSGTVRHRCGPHSIVPYIEVEWGDVALLTSLREVVLKPTPHMDLASHAARSLIASEYQRAGMPYYEMTSFEISESKIPYREGS
jgi:hypothetical protein